MSTDPIGLILEAVSNGEASLPALKRATGLDYSTLTTALEGPLAGAVRREETVDGFLRFYPNGTVFEQKVECVSGSPFCVQCHIECKKTHKSGEGFVGGETRWKCPKCHVGFSGTHAKQKEKIMDEHAAAKERLNEIIAKGQPCPKCGGKKSSSAEMCRKCFEDVTRNGRRPGDVGGRPVVDIDLKKLEDLLADPDQRITDIGEAFGTNRNTIYYRKDTDPEFKAAYDRGMKRREEAIARQFEGKNIDTDAETEAGLGEVEVAPAVEDLELRLALDPNEEDTGPVRLQVLSEASPVGDTARPFIPLLSPAAPTLEEAREAQRRGINHEIEMTGEFPPSVVIKKIVWDDDFFMASYETLLAILDDDMTIQEKDAIWLLIRYLKRVEKRDLMSKFFGGELARDEALRAVNGE